MRWSYRLSRRPLRRFAKRTKNECPSRRGRNLVVAENKYIVPQGLEMQPDSHSEWRRSKIDCTTCQVGGSNKTCCCQKVWSESCIESGTHSGTGKGYHPAAKPPWELLVCFSPEHSIANHSSSKGNTRSCRAMHSITPLAETANRDQLYNLHLYTSGTICKPKQLIRRPPPGVIVPIAKAASKQSIYS